MNVITYVELEKGLSIYANPTAAADMQQYMRNKFEFYGIKTPLRREIVKTILQHCDLPVGDEFSHLLYDCYASNYRELHHCAIELLYREKKAWTDSMIPLIEFFIATNSWWDTVDAIATKIVWHYFLKFPKNKNKTMQMWLHSENIWLQRSAIIFQIPAKNMTDVELLFCAIRHCADSKEFFLQKGIGWALREYAKTSPNSVIEFVRTTPLSSLSRREALKYLHSL